MKKLASILVLVFAFTLTTQAQKKRTNERVKLSIEQQTNLAVKKMTLDLDLSKKQQNDIRPLISEQIAERKNVMEKRKTAKKENKKPTADQIYAMKSKMLDNKIAMKNKMKTLLNKEQFAKFEKTQKGRKMRGMKKMHKKHKNIEENN
jgi:hypothetical protein